MGAYQAFTEYLDRYVPVRTRGDRVLARADRAMGTATATRKARAFAALAA